MELDSKTVKFSRNDIKNRITLPHRLDSNLAYLLGIQVGDGYLKKVVREYRIEYCIMYDGHSINDLKWYNFNLKSLLKDIFNKEVNVNDTSSGTVQIRFRSKAIFTFLNRICGVSQSPKTHIRIPNIIMISDASIKRVFLRGLADTDFSLTFKKRVKKDYYPVIYFQTSSKSLYEDTTKLLVDLGFRIVHNYRKSYRYDKVYDSYYMQISGRKQLSKWMKEIGFESFNHMTRYLVWKKLGYLPIDTNIIERNKILNKEAHSGPLTPSGRRSGISY